MGITNKGQIKLIDEMMKSFNIKSSMQLLSVRNSSIALSLLKENYLKNQKNNKGKDSIVLK